MDCDTATRDITGCDTTMTTQFILDKRIYERIDRVSACRQVLAQQQPQDDYHRDPCIKSEHKEIRDQSCARCVIPAFEKYDGSFGPVKAASFIMPDATVAT